MPSLRLPRAIRVAKNICPLILGRRDLVYYSDLQRDFSPKLMGHIPVTIH